MQQLSVHEHFSLVDFLIYVKDVSDWILSRLNAKLFFCGILKWLLKLPLQLLDRLLSLLIQLLKYTDRLLFA